MFGRLRREIYGSSYRKDTLYRDSAYCYNYSRFLTLAFRSQVCHTMKFFSGCVLEFKKCAIYYDSCRSKPETIYQRSKYRDLEL